ncbi:MAG: hypothetical protein AAFR27_12050 [Pseudomonadota bacterium]
MKKTLLIALGFAGIALPATAETQRFVLERTETGYVRMDTQTGDMAFCTEDGNQLVCLSADDERAAFQQQLNALQMRVDELETKLEERLNLIPHEWSEGLPSQEDFDQGLDYMEQFFDRFRGVIEGQEAPSDNRT